MAQSKGAIAAIALSCVASLAHATQWFGDSHGAHRVDSRVNQSDLDIASAPPVALAIDGANGSVWSLTSSRITHYSSEGATLFSGPAEAPANRGGGARLLALNPLNGSLWIAAQNRLSHLDTSGAPLGALNLAANDLAVSQDGALWVLLQQELRRYSDQGALLGSTPIPAGERETRLFALDEAGGKLWVASDRRLTQRDTADPSRIGLSLMLPDEAFGLSVDAQTGTLWVLSKTALLAYSRAGATVVNKSLKSLSLQEPRAIASDAGNQAVWIGHGGGLARLSTAGALVATVPGSVVVRSLAVGDSAPVDVRPTLALLQPQPGALVNGRPTLIFQYGATCNGAPCGFPNSAYASYSLTATLDGISVGAQFNFNSATGQASFQPASPLADGVHELSAQVTNSAGQQSAVVLAQFTVDAVAPQFISIAPPSGSLFTASQVLVSGMVDDPQATVQLSTGQSSTGGLFNFPIILSVGSNTLTLTARDAVGNTSTALLTYTYDPPNTAPTVAITAPANGDYFTSPATFTITASASDSDGSIARVDFFQDGVLLGSDTTSPYSFTVSNLATGTYTFTARATDNRGAVTPSAPVTVTAGPPNSLPTVALKSPVSGTSFSAPASVRAVATAADADGSIAKVEFLSDGVVAATVLAPPYEATINGLPAGSHTIVARATDDRGGVASSAAATVSVAATSLTITSPLPNASITGDSVIVTGTTAGLSNRGVTVNHVVAAVDASGRFTALVPVTPGGNTLTAQLTTPDGTVLSQSVDIFATGVASPFTVKANPMVGMAPLAVTFTVQNPTDGNASYMFDTFGPFSLPAGGTSQLSLTYPAGVAAPNIVITDSTGTVWSHRVVIDSRDPARMDQMFRAIWSNLNASLVAGDKQGALRYLSSHGQEKYGPVFDALMPYMAEIVASYSTLAKGSIGADSGEYAVARMDQGQKRLYLINFMCGADGVWRIDEM